MNLNISISLQDLEEALLDTDVSQSEAFDIINLLDKDVVQDWDFTEVLAKHFVIQMKQLKDDAALGEVWGEFEAWLKEELK